MKPPYILLPILFSILSSGCASAPKAEKAPDSVEKSTAADSDTKAVATSSTTPAAPAEPAQMAQQQSQTPVQSTEPIAQPKPVKVDSPVNESLVNGPPIIPAMLPVPGKNYEIGKYEVTQAEWRSVMGLNPSKFKDCGDTCPVEKVSWDDVQIYLQRLNAKTGKQYRLPSEAEWEYACYGGNQSEYCGGNDVDAVAWAESRGNELTHPVGQKKANGYGLYDMSGNVMEWTTDCWEGNCAQRVFRGGSWFNDPRDVRVTYRIRFGTAIRNSSGGFRLVRTLP
jgi:formylglycine-generating enzyme required for sulfatase activity